MNSEFCIDCIYSKLKYRYTCDEPSRRNPTGIKSCFCTINNQFISFHSNCDKQRKELKQWHEEQKEQKHSEQEETQSD